MPFFVKLFLVLGVYNAFDAVFFFRAVYAALNIWSLVALWRFFKERYPLSQWWLLWTSLIWFFPYIHVRTSSENLSGIFLCFAILALLKNKNFFWSGILFGFSFLARYQIALGLFGLGLALIVQERKLVRKHFKLLAGFLVTVVLGVILDRIGYGEWFFTAYRYFKVNLIDGVAATFNPYPWYQYFIWVLQLSPIVSLPLFSGCILFCLRARREDALLIGSFVWSFFILHCCITNKEYRFLFPLLNLAPFMTMIAFQRFEPCLSKKRLLIPYFIINLLAFMVSTLHGASLHLLGSITLVDRYHHEGDTWLSNRNYRELGPNEQYYSNAAPPPIIYVSPAALDQMLNQNSRVKVLMDGNLNDQVTLDFIAVIDQHQCRLLNSTLPMWVHGLRTRFPIVGRMSYQAAYDCDLKNN